jgi:hypothetical protein
MKQSQSNLKKVIHSVEMDYLLSEFTFMIIACALFAWLGGAKTIRIVAVTAVVAITAFHLWQVIRICRKPDSYIFCSAVLNQPHRSDWINAMYFTVIIEDAEGNRFPANTHDIFFTHSITGLSLEDYVNKTVEVGYNMETGHVVVIG